MNDYYFDHITNFGDEEHVLATEDIYNQTAYKAGESKQKKRPLQRKTASNLRANRMKIAILWLR